MLDTISSFNESLEISTRCIKHKLTNENSTSLWHKRLGHISKQKIDTLVSDKIPDPLDFTNFDVCVNYVKGKHKNIRRLGASRTSDVLELIHTDIYGSFPMTS